VASAAGRPPAASTASGAGTVLWGFGIGIGAVGLALGMRSLWNQPGTMNVGLDGYTKLN
jgi:hypothetical protein